MLQGLMCYLGLLFAEIGVSGGVEVVENALNNSLADLGKLGLAGSGIAAVVAGFYFFVNAEKAKSKIIYVIVGIIVIVLAVSGTLIAVAEGWVQGS